MVASRRRAAIALLAAFVAAPLVWVGHAAYVPVGDANPHPFNHDRNATWLEHRWLERPHSEREMEGLLRGLKERGIQYAFPHIIPFDASGRLPPHDRAQVRAFLETARRVNPELRILPWVGGLRLGHRRTLAGAIDLSNMAQRQAMVAECRSLIDEGFDGVHVNIEPVASGDVEFVALLRALKTAVGPDRLLSVSATRPGPVSLPFASNFLWTPGYYARVGSVADQIVVMAYDTALPTPALYRRYVAYAARTATRSVPAHASRARVLLGVPTYDDASFMHRRGVETAENALLGIVAGLRGVGEGGTFEGVALYAEWTTSDVEWQDYDRIWRGRAAGRNQPSARTRRTTALRNVS
jgi:hypothetical protein